MSQRILDENWVHIFDALVKRGQVEVVTSNDARAFRITAVAWHAKDIMLQLELPWSQVTATFLPRDLSDRESEIAFGILEAVEENVKHTDQLNESINAYMGIDKWTDPNHAKDDEIRAVIDRMRTLLGIQP